MENSEKFKRFIHARFIAWETKRGEKGDVTSFAKMIGAYQGDVSHWLKGTRVPGVKVLQKITQSEWIGPEAWEAAGYGYLVKDPLLLRTMISLETLPRPVQEFFAAEIEKKAAETNEGQSLTFQTA